MNRLIKFALAGAMSLGLMSPVFGAQGTGCMPTTGTVSGLTFAQDVNAAIAALISSNSGASAPTTDCTAVAIKGQLWLDTSVTPNAMRQYDGSGTWVTIGFLDATNHLFAPPIGGGISTVTAAATTNLGALSSAAVTVSGNTTITSFGSSAVAGTIYVLTFSGAPVITYNVTSMITPGAVDLNVAAGGIAFVSYISGSNWKVLAYQAPGVSPQLAAYAFRANNTAARADPTEVTIAGLTTKATPTSSDYLMIADVAASNAFKKITGASVGGLIGTANGIDKDGSNNVQLTAARRTLPTTQVFTSGSGTYTTPANVLWIEVELVGGGSGGGALNSTLSTAGGNTTFSTFTANGGAASSGAAVGAGGTASGGFKNITGGRGGCGTGGTTLNGVGGPGGNSSLGGAGAGLYNVAGFAAATNSGSGGGGGSANSTSINPGCGGSAGGTAIGIINTPSATYSYGVGAGGAGTPAGTAAGGVGGAGLITVIEHYGS